IPLNSPTTPPTSIGRIQRPLMVISDSWASRTPRSTVTNSARTPTVTTGRSFSTPPNPAPFPIYPLFAAGSLTMLAGTLAARTTGDSPPTLSAALHPDGRPGGWFGDYLRDPGATLLALLHHISEWAISWGPLLGPVLALGVAALVGTRWWWARRCHARLL